MLHRLALTRFSRRKKPLSGIVSDKTCLQIEMHIPQSSATMPAACKAALTSTSRSAQREKISATNDKSVNRKISNEHEDCSFDSFALIDSGIEAETKHVRRKSLQNYQ